MTPFEQWRVVHLDQMAVSAEILELLARAFEGGRQSRQPAIDTLHEMYTMVCGQRDELMDQQRSMMAAMRGKLQ